jgi:hypothetical protein
MSETKVEFIKSQGFTVNLPNVGPSVAIRTESDEIVILVRLTLRPRDNMMDIGIDVSAGRDGASMPSLDENTSPDLSRYWRTDIHKP